MPRKGSGKKFSDRQNITIGERNLFLGKDKEFAKFQELMKKPIKNMNYECNQPLQIRVMGNLEDVRDFTKKMTSLYGMNDPKEIPSNVVGLSKLECDKSERVGNFCFNAIRAYINPTPKYVKKEDKCIAKRSE